VCFNANEQGPLSFIEYCLWQHQMVEFSAQFLVGLDREVACPGKTKSSGGGSDRGRAVTAVICTSEHDMIRKTP
jgi:hypothetical protein